MPRLNGSRITCAPAAAATSAVRSVEPSETTTTSSPESNARSSSSTRTMLRSSLKAGTIAILRNAARRASPATARSCTSVDTGGLGADADEVEQLLRAVAIGVLVEHALARAPSQLLRLRGIGEQLAVGRDRLVGVVDDDQLGPGLEPALEPVVRVRDDRGARRGELERTARRRRVDGRVRAA